MAKVLVVVKEVFGGATCPQASNESRWVLEGPSLKSILIQLANKLARREDGPDTIQFEDFSTIQIERLPEE